MSGILSDLPLLKWRGLSAPCTSSSYDGGHRQSERLYPFIDAAGHDNVGRAAYRIPDTTLLFHNGIKPSDWYPHKWNEFHEALRDGTAGPLEHPDLGPVLARVLTWHVVLDAGNRGGVTVTVAWTETRDNLEEDAAFVGPDVSPKAAAEQADANLADLTPPELPDFSIPGLSTFTDAIAQIEGAVLSLELTAGGLINQVQGVIAKTYGNLDRRLSHDTYAAQASLTQLYDVCRVLRQKSGGAAIQRPTASFTVTGETTLDALARQLGNTVSDLAGLNSSLLRSPIVPDRSVVTYYK